MIENNKIKVNISYRNITHYIKLGYSPILNVDLEISTEHLPSSSHVKVIAICSICGVKKEMIYAKYFTNKNNHGFYGCKKCSRQKAALTSMKRYGVDNYSKTDEYKSRVEKTNMSKYGYKTNLISPEFIEINKQILLEKYNTEKFYEIRTPSNKTKFKLNDNIQDYIQTFERSEDLYNNHYLNSDYLLYRNECRRITAHNIKSLFENWDGHDYYDNEDIKSFTSLEHNSPNYPTIDHKMSIYYGFKNSIDPMIIGSIDNLCITKRYINSKKRDMNENEFKST